MSTADAMLKLANTVEALAFDYAARLVRIRARQQFATVKQAEFLAAIDEMKGALNEVSESLDHLAETVKAEFAMLARLEDDELAETEATGPEHAPAANPEKFPD